MVLAFRGDFGLGASDVVGALGVVDSLAVGDPLLDAVVAGVGDVHVAGGGDGDALGCF